VPDVVDSTRTARRAQGLLVALALLDLALVVWAFALPDLWFRAFHGGARVDPQHLLQRMGANWAAFFVLELLAALRWRREPVWLAVVAGVRLSDMFTDATYVVCASEATPFAWATLPLSSLMNLLMGLWLLRAWRLLASGPTGGAPASPA
jgi:hypothetical protein